MPILLWVVRLEVSVLDEWLEIRFIPFRRRRIPLGHIISAETTVYSPLGDYSGWGIRLGSSGWAYTVSGRQGVRLGLKDGTQLLLGSRQSEALAQALKPPRPSPETPGSPA